MIDDRTFEEAEVDFRRGVEKLFAPGRSREATAEERMAWLQFKDPDGETHSVAYVVFCNGALKLEGVVAAKASSVLDGCDRTITAIADYYPSHRDMQMIWRQLPTIEGIGRKLVVRARILAVPVDWTVDLAGMMA